MFACCPVRPYEAVNLQAGASLLIGGSEGIADF
jgi:hypothetical protein